MIIGVSRSNSSRGASIIRSTHLQVSPSARSRAIDVARRSIRPPRGFRRCGHYHGNERRNQAPSNRSDGRRLFHNGNDATRSARRSIRIAASQRRAEANLRYILSEVFCPGTCTRPWKTFTWTGRRRVRQSWTTLDMGRSIRADNGRPLRMPHDILNKTENVSVKRSYTLFVCNMLIVIFLFHLIKPCCLLKSDTCKQGAKFLTLHDTYLHTE